MKSEISWVAAMLIVVAVSLWDAKASTAKRVTGDFLICASTPTTADKPEQCDHVVISGKAVVSVTPGANACAGEFTNESGNPQLKAGRQLIYIDDENWECKLPVSNGLEDVVRLNNGDLTIITVDTDHSIPDSPYAVKRTDTLVGEITHLFRAWKL